MPSARWKSLPWYRSTNFSNAVKSPPLLTSTSMTSGFVTGSLQPVSMFPPMRTTRFLPSLQVAFLDLRDSLNIQALPRLALDHALHHSVCVSDHGHQYINTRCFHVLPCGGAASPRLLENRRVGGQSLQT